MFRKGVPPFPWQASISETGEGSQSPALGSQTTPADRWSEVWGVLTSLEAPPTSSNFPGYGWKQVLISGGGGYGGTGYVAAGTVPAGYTATGLAYDHDGRSTLPVDGSFLVRMYRRGTNDASTGADEWYFTGGQGGTSSTRDWSFYQDTTQARWQPLYFPALIPYGAGTFGSALFPAGYGWAVPFISPRGGTFDRAGISGMYYNLGTIGGPSLHWRAAIYEAGGTTNLYPGTLLADIGQLTTISSFGSGLVYTTCSVTLKPDQVYFFVLKLDATHGNDPNVFGLGYATETSGGGGQVWGAIGITEHDLSLSGDNGAAPFTAVPQWYMGWGYVYKFNDANTDPFPATFPANAEVLDGRETGTPTNDGQLPYAPLLWARFTDNGSNAGGSGGPPLIVNQITIGATTIVGGTSGDFIYDAGGLFGEYPPATADAALGASVGAISGKFF